MKAGARNRIVRNSHADLDSSVLQHNTILRCAAPSSNSIPQPPGITTIPPELLCMIFELLGPVASTCAGLTCHKFYAIHRSYHGQVSLYRRVKDVNGRSHRLIYLLREWMRPNWLIGPRLGSRRPLPCFVRVENWGEWDADKVMADYVMWCEKNLTREELWTWPTKSLEEYVLIFLAMNLLVCGFSPHKLKNNMLVNGKRFFHHCLLCTNEVWF